MTTTLAVEKADHHSHHTIMVPSKFTSPLIIDSVVNTLNTLSSRYSVSNKLIISSLSNELENKSTTTVDVNVWNTPMIRNYKNIITATYFRMNNNKNILICYSRTAILSLHLIFHHPPEFRSFFPQISTLAFHCFLFYSRSFSYSIRAQLSN